MNRQLADFDRFIVTQRVEAMPPTMLVITRTHQEFAPDSASGYVAIAADNLSLFIQRAMFVQLRRRLDRKPLQPGIAGCAGIKGLPFLWNFWSALVSRSEPRVLMPRCG